MIGYRDATTIFLLMMMASFHLSLASANVAFFLLFYSWMSARAMKVKRVNRSLCLVFNRFPHHKRRFVLENASKISRVTVKIIIFKNCRSIFVHFLASIGLLHPTTIEYLRACQHVYGRLYKVGDSREMNKSLPIQRESSTLIYYHSIEADL